MQHHGSECKTLNYGLNVRCWKVGRERRWAEGSWGRAGKAAWKRRISHDRVSISDARGCQSLQSLARVGRPREADFFLRAHAYPQGPSYPVNSGVYLWWLGPNRISFLPGTGSGIPVCCVCCEHSQLKWVRDKGVYHTFCSKRWSQARCKQIALVFNEHLLYTRPMQEVMGVQKKTYSTPPGFCFLTYKMKYLKIWCLTWRLALDILWLVVWPMP